MSFSTFDALCDALDDDSKKKVKNKTFTSGGVKFETVTEDDKKRDFLKENAPPETKSAEEGENEVLSATVLYDMWSKSSDIMSLAERYAMERKRRGLDPVHKYQKKRTSYVPPRPKKKNTTNTKNMTPCTQRPTPTIIGCVRMPTQVQTELS